ncbi:MAG: N-methyl-L-tryptophan oxidase [Candidatus Hydrogenedentes bacterium]|nr:N-methyl-L-tryptophan oxidase [Candidatus Hydrogenedentota bacterium]
MPTYDVIVLGLGGMGSATLYHLAKRGVRVCGVEQFGIAHDKGSSHGATRMIRKAYFEHPDYVPLVEKAYGLWRELELESGAELLVQSGLLLSGKPGSGFIRGLETCYRVHPLPHERIDAAEAMNRHPQFRLPDDHAVYWDPDGGYLRVEGCVDKHVQMAQKHGADVLIHEDVLGWRSDANGVSITTTKRELHAAKLVLTAGAWTTPSFVELLVPLRVLRKVQFWYTSPNITEFRRGACPGYFIETDYGSFYGFPTINDQGMKVSEHSGGEPVEDPDELDRGLHAHDEDGVLRFITDVFPSVQPSRTRFSVCMYSMTADEHFIIDRHPRHPNVVIAGGFSGHGFKFASVIGEILADLTMQGSTPHPIGFLGLGRFTSF